MRTKWILLVNGQVMGDSYDDLETVHNVVSNFQSNPKYDNDTYVVVSRKV